MAAPVPSLQDFLADLNMKVDTLIATLTRRIGEPRLFSRPLSVIAVGEMGCGKTSLTVDSLLQNNLSIMNVSTNEDLPIAKGKFLNSSKDVIARVVDIDVDLGSSRHSDRGIKEIIKEADIIFHCIRLDSREKINFLKYFSFLKKQFSLKEISSKTMIVLTIKNYYNVRFSLSVSKLEMETVLLQTEQIRHDVISQYLHKLGAPEDDVNNMPICVAGGPNDIDVWLTTFYHCCIRIAEGIGIDIPNDVSQISTIKNNFMKLHQKALIKGMEEGYVSLKIIKMVICGPPCVGKTAFKDLLLDKPPPLSHHSTPIAARPVHAIERIAAGGKVWKEITEEDLLQLLTDIICSIRSPSFDQAVAEPPNDSRPTNVASIESVSISKSEQTPQPASATSTHATAQVSSHATVPIVTDNIDEVSRKIIKKFSSPRKEKGSQKLHEATWIYLLDSGGQPQFTDLLRMFVRGNSLYIIVMKVTESLHDKPTFVYSINGKALNTPKEMTMTNLQIIERFVRSIAATSREDNDKPAFAIIATHSDQSKFKRFFGLEERIREKNETLLSCLGEFLDLFIFYNWDSNKLIYPVDNLCWWNREKISADICCRLVSSRADIIGNIKIPVRWYVFDLNMKNEASKETHGMISLESCHSIGQRLGIDEEEVNKCLIYLDSMRLCIYYPKVLPHVIFTNPQFLIDSLSNIARVSFVDDLTEIGIKLSHEDLKSLKRDGVFEKSLLESLELNLVPDLFSKEDLLFLLQHFLVISNIKTADESPRYFIPMLLPAERLNEEQKALFAQVADPLFIQFDKTVLQGLFPTLVVSLLGREEDPLFFIDSRTSEFPQQLQHAVKLYTEELFGSVFLCENYESIEVYFTGRPRHCHHLRKVILESLSISAKVLQYDEKKINMSAVVRCNRKHSVPANDKMIHPITISYKIDPPEIGCSVETSLPTITINDLSEKQSCWLIRTAGTYPDTISLPTDGDAILNHTHAPIVLDAIKSVVFQWMILGIYLGIEKYKLEEIKYNSRDQVQVCHKDMIHHWIDTRRCTCNGLIKALEMLDENKIVCDIKRLQTA